MNLKKTTVIRVHNGKFIANVNTLSTCQSIQGYTRYINPFKDEAQTALFKDPVRTAQ